MTEPAYVARPVEWLLPALLGEVRVSADATVRIEDFFVPLAPGATFPWKSHALWFYTKMVRWGQIEHTSGHEAIARETYRPDLYRAALKPLWAPLPAANYRVEGAFTAPTPVGARGATLTLGPDGFFDGGLFDPDHVSRKSGRRFSGSWRSSSGSRPATIQNTLPARPDTHTSRSRRNSLR